MTSWERKESSVREQKGRDFFKISEERGGAGREGGVEKRRGREGGWWKFFSWVGELHEDGGEGAGENWVRRRRRGNFKLRDDGRQKRKILSLRDNFEEFQSFQSWFCWRRENISVPATDEGAATCFLTHLAVAAIMLLLFLLLLRIIWGSNLTPFLSSVPLLVFLSHFLHPMKSSSSDQKRSPDKKQKKGSTDGEKKRTHIWQLQKMKRKEKGWTRIGVPSNLKKEVSHQNYCGKIQTLRDKSPRYLIVRIKSVQYTCAALSEIKYSRSTSRIGKNLMRYFHILTYQNKHTRDDACILGACMSENWPHFRMCVTHTHTHRLVSACSILHFHIIIK